MEHIPKIFIAFGSKFFTVLGDWAWVFIIVVALAAVVILNRGTIKDIFSVEKLRFYTKDHREFDSVFSDNIAVKTMIENGEEGFINCAHCKHLKSCKKCSEFDYDIAETVCGDFEL